jgi:hypothetical protein
MSPDALPASASISVCSHQSLFPHITTHNLRLFPYITTHNRRLCVHNRRLCVVMYGNTAGNRPGLNGGLTCWGVGPIGSDDSEWRGRVTNVHGVAWGWMCPDFRIYLLAIAAASIEGSVRMPVVSLQRERKSPWRTHTHTHTHKDGRTDGRTDGQDGHRRKVGQTERAQPHRQRAGMRTRSGDGTHNG